MSPKNVQHAAKDEKTPVKRGRKNQMKHRW
jgi:hypothetical protein